MASRVAPVLPLLIAVAIAGCGYTVGFAAGPRFGIRTVSIRTAGNETFRQRLDVALTRRLGRDLNQYTGLVPGTVDGADARLEVTLNHADGQAITELGGGRVLEGAIRLEATARLIDQRSGAVLYEGTHSDWAEFRTTVKETRDGAIEESIADLSRKILTAIDGGWPAR